MVRCAALLCSGFDGLQTYLRYVCSRDWLGGWLLPQEKSWFALQLPHGWWVFALDNALNNDIDPTQFQYFARLAATMGEDDRVILCYHEPDWVINAHEKVDICQNIAYLQSTLQGKVVLKLAGDLHHYTRHMPSDPAASAAPPPTATATASAEGPKRDFVNANTPSEVDLWQWWNPVSWCRSFMTGRHAYNSRVFLEDVLEDIAPEVNSQVKLIRTQSLPILDPRGGDKDSRRDSSGESSARPLSRVSYSLVDSPPPSPPHTHDASPATHKLHSRRVHVVLPNRSPSSSPLPWQVGSPNSPLSPAPPSLAAVPGALSVVGSGSFSPVSPVTTLRPRKAVRMQEWDVDEVCRWLKASGLADHVAAFRQHDIDGKLLCRLDDDDLLAELGIASRLTRKKILAERDARMHKRSSTPTPSTSTVLPESLQLSPDALSLVDSWKDAEELKEEPLAMPAYARSSTEHSPPTTSPIRAQPPLLRTESTLGYDRIAFSAPSSVQRQPPILIVSGGGGAFLHGTHTPSSGPLDVRGEPYVRTTSYPSISTSRAYALLNIFGQHRIAHSPAAQRRTWMMVRSFAGVLISPNASVVCPLCWCQASASATGGSTSSVEACTSCSCRPCCRCATSSRCWPGRAGRTWWCASCATWCWCT